MAHNTKTLAIALAVAVSLLPILPPVAISEGTVVVGDAVAGVGAEAQMKGFAPNLSADFVLRPPSGDLAAFPIDVNAQGNAQFHIPASSIQVAGTYGAFIGSEGKKISAETTFNVLPDSPDPDASTIDVSSAHIAADGRDSSAVTVVLQDRYGNLLAHRPVELVLSDASALAKSLTQETDARGVQQFSVTATQPGVISVRALDILSDTQLNGAGTITAGEDAVGGTTTAYNATSSYVPPTHSNPFAADLLGSASKSFDVLAGFEVTIDPASLKVNETGNMTIRAIDRNGQTVEDYAGTVKVTSPTDPDATLPGFGTTPGEGEVKFLPKYLGRKVLPFSLVFKHSGNQTIAVEDDTNPRTPIRGEATVNVTGGTETQNHLITITSPAPDSTVGSKPVTIEGTGVPYTNIQISGGASKVTGDADAQGHFSVSVPLDANYNEYTFHITDDQGNDASLHLVRDTEPPVIRSVTFSPAKPQEGSSTLLVVQSEPGLPSVSVKMGGDDLPLKEEDSKPGTYSILFNAPKAGDYQLPVSATDSADNATQYLAPLTTTAKELPKVGGLKATPRMGSIDLSWNPVTADQVSKYRVYVGEQQGDFAYTLDTTDTTTKARVTGLKNGGTYYFAVTALKNDLESPRSDVVTARPLGITLNVTPQEEALFLEWSFPNDTSLSSFMVEYGTEPTALSEKRTVQGGDMKADEKRSIILRDLIPGVVYYFVITPVATEGTPIKDLIVKGQGTPLPPGGFHPAAGDQVPPMQQVYGNGLGDLLTTAPTIPQSGLPIALWWIAGAAGTMITLMQWSRRRASRETRAFLRSMEARYRGS